jgi:hypothetical protein
MGMTGELLAAAGRRTLLFGHLNLLNMLVSWL